MGSVSLLVLPTPATPIAYAQNLTAAERAKLEAELAQLEAEIKQQEQILNDQKKQTGAISSEVQKLARDIQSKKREIQDKNRQIANLSSEINNKQQTIQQLQESIERQKDSLAQILRKQHQLDDSSLFEVVLSKATVSDFFIDADDFTSVKRSLEESFDLLRSVQNKTAAEKISLEEKRDQETNVKAELDLEKRRVEDQEKDQKYLLEQSKSKEKSYEQILAEKQAKAAAIKAKLFTFQDDTKIPFGQAYEFAKVASAATGVAPAFILATLAQETGYNGETFGRNVGQCYLKNAEDGSGTTINGTPRTRVMKPSRDVQPFIKITTSLGMDPYTTPISCPLSYGWGGAMGIAQFIASTWNAYASQIAKAVGASVANPWNPQHGITAAAVYLGDLGADKGTKTAEMEASCRYYSGRSCQDPNVSNIWYAQGVQSKRATIQEDIDFLESF